MEKRDRKGTYKRGQIYWIGKSPYNKTYGSVNSPGRPGIVVSNDVNNSCSNTVEIIYLTTALKKGLPTHCPINSAIEPSTALCEQVTTVSTDQVGRYIGTCTTAEMTAVERCMRISLGLRGPEATTELTEHDRLVRNLIKAREREAIIREMYQDLLERFIAK